MQLKNALIGAIVGGVIGIGVLVAAFMLFGAQHTALALIIAILVGGGVRAMVSTKGHASYLRGAITALVAIAAFVGGNFVVAQVARSQMAANASKPMRATPAPKLEDRAALAEGGEQAAEVVEEDVEARTAPDGARIGAPMRAPIQPTFSTPDFIWLTVAALVAYELGRGTGATAAAPPVGDATPEPSPSA